MSGENDQTDGNEAEPTEAEDTGSTEGQDPETEARAAWLEFTGNRPEDDETDEDDDSGDGEGSEAAAADTGQETSDTDADPAPESAEGEQSSEDDEGEGESSSDATDGAASAGDIWASAPKELRDAFDAERTRAARAEQEVASSRGRISNLQSRLDASLGKPPEQRNTAGAADTSPDAGDSRPNPFETDEWKGLRDEFGDIAEPIEKILTPLVGEVGALRAENQRLRQGMETIGQDRLHTRAQSQEAAVREAHPDYDDILQSQEFAGWVQAAPAYLREGLERNGRAIVDAAEASDILKRFKQDTGYGSEGGDGDGSGSSTGQETEDANGKDAGGAEANGKDGDGSKPAAPSRRRQIQLDSASAPRARSGEAAVSDKEPETQAEMWAWAKKKSSADREAAV